MASVSLCNLSNLLADYQYKLIVLLNSKFDSLRRLADLLENLGDLSSLLPPFSSLFPLSAIDLNTYEQLRQACPSLGLPPVEDEINEEIDKLRARVGEAYDRILRDLKSLPWFRMGKLQDEMDKFRSKVGGVIDVSGEFLECLQAACNAQETVQSAWGKVSQVSVDDIRSNVNNYNNNFTVLGVGILTHEQKAKARELERIGEELNNLIDISYNLDSIN